MQCSVFAVCWQYKTYYTDIYVYLNRRSQLLFARVKDAPLYCDVQKRSGDRREDAARAAVCGSPTFNKTIFARARVFTLYRLSCWALGHRRRLIKIGRALAKRKLILAMLCDDYSCYSDHTYTYFGPREFLSETGERTRFFIRLGSIEIIMKKNIER